MENVAAAIALAIADDRAAGRIYNVADLDAPTELEWVEEILACCGAQARVECIDDEELPAHLRHRLRTEQSIAVDSSRIRAELGYYDVVDRSTAICKTAAWAIEHQPIGQNRQGQISRPLPGLHPACR